MPLGYEHIYANYSKCFAPTLSIIGIFQKTKLLQIIQTHEMDARKGQGASEKRI